jgi:chromosomal replication initiator protein
MRRRQLSKEEPVTAAVSQQMESISLRVHAALASRVDESTYRIWLKPLEVRPVGDHRLLVEAPVDACAWICERYGRLIRDAASGVLGPDTTVQFVPRGDAAHGPPSATRARRSSPAASPSPLASSHASIGAASAPAQPAHAQSTPLDNPKLTFDQFVIGDCNRLAHAAALTVAELPAQAYNPLFICGPPGVGKTHLLGAIAALVLSHNPNLAVRWTTGEAFTNEFLRALSSGHVEAFKARFRDVDVLLLDDVQFLERKTRTEEEFFHTFNALYDGGRQIVLTSDRPPRDLQALEDRLRERFQAGLVADIGPPEFATRLAILHKRVQHDHLDLADERALEALAQRITHNVRALEGALIRVVAYSSLTGRALTPTLVHEVLHKLYPHGSRASRSGPESISDIQLATCAHFGISVDELLSGARGSRVAWPRAVAMYLARELTHESLPAIGRSFGGRDHTTVLHAWRRTRARITVDDSAREAVDKLTAELCHQTRA